MTAEWIHGIDAAKGDVQAPVQRTPDRAAPVESSRILAELDGLATAVAEIQAQLTATGRSSVPDATPSDDRGRTVWGYRLADGRKLDFIFSSGVVLSASTSAPFRVLFPGER